MIYSYDRFQRLENPIITLCNPDDTEIGVLQNHSKLKTSLVFNDISEISLVVHQCGDNGEVCEIYHNITERRQIHIEGIGYFVINCVSEISDETGVYKSITAKSCESELNNIAMPYVDRTYVMYRAADFDADSGFPSALTSAELASNDDYLNSNSILYEILRVIPHWHIKNALQLATDANYQALAEKYRTFDSGDQTIYSFLKNEFQNTFDCFVSFDIESRGIEILLREDALEELNFTISKANLLEKCELTTNTDSYVNSLYTDSQNGAFIQDINPLGGASIYNFDHDIESGLIPANSELGLKLQSWKEAVANSRITAVSSLDASEYKYLARRCQTDGYVFGNDTVCAKCGETLPCRNGYCPEHNLVESNGEMCPTCGELLLYQGNINDYIDEILADITISEIDITGATWGDIVLAKKTLLNTFVNDIIGASQQTSYYDTREANTNIVQMRETYDSWVAELAAQKTYLKGYQTQLAALEATDGALEDKGLCPTHGFIEDTSHPTVCSQTTSGVVCGKSIIYPTDNVRIVKFNILKTELLINALTGSFDETDGETAEITTPGIIDRIRNDIETNLNYVQTAVTALQFENFFQQCYRDEGEEDWEALGSELYRGLVRYIKQQKYSDENIVVTDAMSLDERFTQEAELYNNAVGMLARVSSPDYQINITAGNFSTLPAFKEICSNLRTGSVICVEMPNGEIFPYNLLQIDTDYDACEMELLFGNRINIYNPTAIFDDLSSTSATAANLVASDHINWGIASKNVSYLMAQKDADLDLTYRSIRSKSSDYQRDNVEYDANGLRCMYAEYEDGEWVDKYGIWASSGTLMFTDDGWQTPRTAIGKLIDSEGKIKYGFYGESIIANTVTADKLVAGSVVSGTNLIRDGSFENAIASNRADDTVLQSQNWQYSGGNNAAIRIIYDTMAKFGDRYLRIAPSRAATTVLNYSTQVHVDPTQKYTISFYCRGDLTAPNERVTVACGELSCDAMEGDISSTEWRRFSTTGYLGTNAEINIAISVITDNSQSFCDIDGVMLERTEILNDYSPHISEHYAKYTRIDDSGINVFGGKINIYNNAGSNVFSADNDGNLSITGQITATSGFIGTSENGWAIDENGIANETASFLRKTPYPNALRIGNTDVENLVLKVGGNFGVSGSGALFASSATISGTITATSGEVGGWRINNNHLSSTNPSTNAGACTINLNGNSGNISFVRGTQILGNISGESREYSNSIGSYWGSLFGIESQTPTTISALRISGNNYLSLGLDEVGNSAAIALSGNTIRTFGDIIPTRSTGGSGSNTFSLNYAKDYLGSFQNLLTDPLLQFTGSYSLGSESAPFKDLYVRNIHCPELTFIKVILANIVWAQGVSTLKDLLLPWLP